MDVLITIDYFKQKSKSLSVNNKDKMWDVFDDKFWECVVNDLSNFRRNGLSCGIEIGLLQSDRHKIIGSGTLLPHKYTQDYTEQLKRRLNCLLQIVPLEFIASKLEFVVGNPQHTTINGMTINTNDLYNIYDSWQILRVIEQLGWCLTDTDSKTNKKVTFLEIGGGFGCLAHKLLKGNKGIRYISIDLPETLVLQHYYLSSLHPELKISLAFDGNINNVDVLLLTPIEAFKVLSNDNNNIDINIAIQTRGFSEMNAHTLDEYFGLIQCKIKDNCLFYLGCERYIAYRGESKIGIRDYPFDDDWTILISQPSFLATHGHDFMLMRKKPIIPFTKVLQTFPVVTPPPGPLTVNYSNNIESWIYNNKVPMEDLL